LKAVRRIIRSVDLHSRQLARQCGLTGPQLVVLRELERVEASSPGELARAVSLSNATVTGILDRLGRMELIVRERSTQDQRKVVVRLSAKGREMLARAPSPLQEQFVEQFSRLPDYEQSQILSSLQRIAHLMGAQHLDAAPLMEDL
jgi:DNA-binding MarR family transcriptional regulator